MAIRTSIPQPSLCGGRYISRNGMELEVICAVMKNLVQGQNRSRGTIFGCQKLSPRTRNVSVLTKSGPVRYKCQAHNENAT